MMKQAGMMQNASEQESEERLRALGRITSSVAHDFNNLLTTMIGTSEAALAQPGLSEAFADALRCLRADAQRGAVMVQKILKPVPTTTATLQEAMPIDAAILRSGPLLRRVLGAKIPLKLDLRGGSARILLDTSQFERVLTNLATNARDAMPNGGTFTVRTRVVKTPNGKRVVVSARDTGRGIPAAILPHIFDRFFTTHPENGGTGIGLASVRDIVCEAGGMMSVHSKIEQGTDFRIRLPCRVDQQQRRLLFVDDSALLRQLANVRFAAAGWIVETAASVEEALELADHEMPAFLITDQTLPDQKGLDLIHTLHRRDPALPTILISGYKPTIPGDLENFVRFVPKPFSFDDLEALMETTR